MNPFDKYLFDFNESLAIQKYARRTVINYAYHLRGFFNWLRSQGIHDLRSVNHHLIKNYQLLVVDKNYSPNTIHLKLRSIKRFFEYLEKTQRLLINPAERIIYPALGERLPKSILTESEIKKLLDAPDASTLRGMRDRAILELLYSTGIRREECAHLAITDVDYKGGYLRISKGKSSKDRVLPIGKKACDYLKEYLLKIRPRYTRNNPGEQRLFVSNAGCALKDQALYVLVKKYARQSGIRTPCGMHTIRRTFATHMLKNDAHPLYIQRLLGHATGETLRRYVKVTANDIKKTHKRAHPRR